MSTKKSSFLKKKFQPPKKMETFRQRQSLAHFKRELRYKYWLAILFLTPITLIFVIGFTEFIYRTWFTQEFLTSSSFLSFFTGLLLWHLSHVCGFNPVKTYVFGHELSHALIARCYGGKILSFHFDRDGGYVETDKSNTLISLAPYLIPLYSILTLIFFGIVGLFLNLHQSYSINYFYLFYLPVKPSYLFACALGFTWAFHLHFTRRTLTIEQSDLLRNGEYFSILIIIFVNLVWLLVFQLLSTENVWLQLNFLFDCLYQAPLIFALKLF
jgi:hypothetical protein